MTYELAKQLKDTGFPPGGKGMKYTKEPLGQFLPFETDVYVPTLCELIEACGEQFSSLSLARDERIVTGWLAVGKKYPNALPKYQEECRVLESNPEEAVAKLWLALNAK